MAKKKTDNKELKPKAPTKKEAAKKEVKVEVPNTKWVFIVMGGKEYKVGRDLAVSLIKLGRATLK